MLHAHCQPTPIRALDPISFRVLAVARGHDSPRHAESVDSLEQDNEGGLRGSGVAGATQRENRHPAVSLRFAVQREVRRVLLERLVDAGDSRV